MIQPGEVFREPHLYDQEIHRVVPRYREIHQFLLESIPFLPEHEFRILELGTGTGLLAAKLLKRFPRAQYWGVDYSPRMLEQAHHRLARYKNRVHLLREDFRRAFLRGPYDVVLSCLAIHHLEDEEKQALFVQIYQSLNRPGFFLNGDTFCSRVPYLYHRDLEGWFQWMRSRGLKEHEIEERFVSHQIHDRPAPLEESLRWMRAAGFYPVETVWKFRNKAVTFAMKA